MTTGTRQGRAEASLLADVGHAFDAAGTDLRRAIGDVCRLVGEWFDDLVFVRLFDDVPALSLGLAWDPDGAAAAEFSAFLDRRASQGRDGLVRYADLLEEPVGVFGVVLDGLLASGDDDLVGVLRRIGTSGGILAPLHVGGRTTGLIGMSCQRHDGDHDDDDVRFLGELAGRIGLAAENARLVGRLRNELERRSHVERRHAALLAHASDVIVVVDAEGRVLDATAALASVCGWRVDQLVGTDVLLGVHRDDRAPVRRLLDEAIERPGPSAPVEFRVRTAAGSSIWVEAIGNNLLHDPAVRGLVITFRDISDRHRATELLAVENGILAAIAEGAVITTILDEVCHLVESSTDGIAAVWRLEPPRGLVFWSAPSMPPGVFDVDRPEMGGDPDAWVPFVVDRIEVADPQEHPQWRGWREVANRFGVACSWSRAIVDPHGVVVGAMVVYLTTMRSPDPREAQVIELATKLAGIALDRERVGQAMTHAATHDALTGLPNRRLFLERLGSALRAGNRCGVLFVDLDDFKHVNDTTGHAAGDRLLQEAAARLAEVLRPGDTIARLGGDEFAVLCHDVADAGALATIAGRIIAAVEVPFVAGQREFHLSASIGMALRDPGCTPSSLLRDADAAMYQAKWSGRGRHALFTPEVRQATVARHTVESELRRAIEQGELVVHYQPVVDLRRDRVAALEALVRWEHPTRGLLAPVAFIGVAEETGLIVRLGEVVVEQACRQVAEWIAAGVVHPAVHLAVNVSVLQLVDPGLPAAVLGALERSGLSPLNLHLEITETAVMGDAERTAETMRQIRELGVRFVIDDFGTGHSSLARLRSLDAEILKLDRSFVADVDTDPAGAEVVASVVGLAHALGKGLVAEGVERAEQLDVLRRLGVDAAQGYHLARPKAPAELERLLSSRSAW